MKLTDHHKRILTELIGECLHVPFPYCDKDNLYHCQKCNKTFTIAQVWFPNRTFTTAQDMYDVYVAIAKSKDWVRFCNFVIEKYWSTFDRFEQPPDRWADLNPYLLKWLLCLSYPSEIEGMMVRVAEWWEGRKNEKEKA
jgi:hypothetical protein